MLVAALRARPARGDRPEFAGALASRRRSPRGAPDRQACLAGNALRILARSMKFRSIAVEGPIGVGKTSFVELLVKKFDAHKVLSSVENPFLRDFYLDKTGAAFQAQLFFLLSRYRQLMELSQRTLFSQVTRLRLHLPEGQDLRLPEPGRLGAADLRQALRDARAAGAEARSRHLPAGRHAAADRAHQAPQARLRGRDLRGLRRRRSRRRTTTSSSTTPRPRSSSSTPTRSISCTTKRSSTT